MEGNICPRCHRKVFFAEEIIGLGAHWHKGCFLCANPECRKRLDSRNCTDHDGEAYCSHCYGKLFGPKGYGYGVGAGTLSMDGGTSQVGPVTSNVSSYQQAFVAPLLETGNRPVAKAVPTGTPVTNGSQQDICRRCGKKVYMAERMMAGGSAWHKLSCFSCAVCKKKLDSTTMCEREGDIYCKTCYGKNFGPKGYGFGIGAGTLSMQQ